MANPYPTFRDNNTRLPMTGIGAKVQVVSDTKFSQKILAIGVAPAFTDYFTAAPSADPTVDWYDAGNQLVTSGKTFTIQALTVNVVSTSIADVDAIVQKGVVILTAQNKEIGRFRVRNLTAGGGTFVAGAQVAAASSVGVLNGLPQSDVWRVSELELQTNQSFKAQLAMPQGALAYTIIAPTTVEIGLPGYEKRPVA